MLRKTTEAPAEHAEITITTGQLMLAFGGLFLLNFLLRVFYIRYDFLNGDEGVRALTAARMLEGARLYAEVVTDKPPGASLFYAAVFALLGRSMKAVHAAAIVWNFATSLIVYLIAARFYNKRIALWAALFFVYFSTNYFTQDMMAANTELLMALPYTAAFYVFMLGDTESDLKGDSTRVVVPQTAGALLAAGLLTGLATLFKQIGVLNLIFFALYEIINAWSAHRTPGQPTAWSTSLRRLFARLSLVAVGFVLVVASLVVWLKLQGALGDFWRNGIVLNMFYIDSEPLGLWIKFSGRGFGFVFFNATLWSFAIWAVWRSARELRRKDGGNQTEPIREQQWDITIAVWAGVSLVAVVMSGRFYGHYFIPALPALSILAGRGWRLLAQALASPSGKRRTQVGVAVLGLLFLVGFFRCHHRTAVLAYETLTGTRTHWSENWGMTKREREAEVISAFVRGRVPPSEPLYIWGYAHDVFWRTGCRPASRYLTPYFIDGRFADAEAIVSSTGEGFRREAAANLLEDLRRTKPRLILDVEGSFMALPHRELVEYVGKHYRDEGRAGPDASRPFRVLQLNDDEL